ncbi:hypothetical protein SAY86_017709 [Trapa natans]|uniref:GRAM domain-containing protein n=1 Tax=Trapa natans TaxID=22666 RepID=A0AAN7M6Q0_TRANT|nr:hypothetical protein SAY86_017709 [Trapa natans]
MESELKAEKEIQVEKESPVKEPDPKHDPAEPVEAPKEDHGISDNSGTSDPGSDSGAARSVARKSVHWSPELVSESPSPPHAGSNPYISSAPAANDGSFSFKESMDTVKNVLGRWGRRVAQTTKKAEDLAGNTWQHLKTGPSFADAAMGRIAQGTKILAEGGYEKVFRQTFETVPEEQLQKSFACYLSTSAGPVMGMLYISSAKLAYCSDSPLSYKSGSQTEWSYYKMLQLLCL